MSIAMPTIASSFLRLVAREPIAGAVPPAGQNRLAVMFAVYAAKQSTTVPDR
jgi:hypothetical protein